MDQATDCRAELVSSIESSPNGPGLFSAESLLHLLKLILAGSPYPKFSRSLQDPLNLAVMALCTIWLPDESGNKLYCAAAPNLPGFASAVGPMLIGPKGASCGTAVYRKESVFATDILNEPIWEGYRDSVSGFGIRAVWSRPLFAGDGNVLGTFAILYREVRTPSVDDRQLIEKVGHIAAVANA